MEDVSIVGLYLAKQVFQVHGATSEGRVVCRKKLSRGQLRAFFAQFPPCVVAMEACAAAHFRAREISMLGHEVRLVPPACVKPFMKRQKNDAADAEAIAEAIAEAASRPTMSCPAVDCTAINEYPYWSSPCFSPFPTVT